MRIHSFTWILICLSLLTAQFMEIVIILLIVIVHEFGHAVVASFYKWEINRIMILPFGGEVATDDFGHKPLKEEFYVILAGPLQHLFLFLFSEMIHRAGLFAGDYFQFFQQMNVMILLTNLLPIWPLDGGKLLFLAVSKKFTFIKSHLYTLQFSFIFMLGFFAWFLLVTPFHINGWLFSSFIFVSLWKAFRQQRYYFLRFLLRKGVWGARKQLVVHPETRISQVLEKFYKDRYHTIVVKDEQTELSTLTERRVITAFFNHEFPYQTIGELVD